MLTDLAVHAYWAPCSVVAVTFFPNMALVPLCPCSDYRSSTVPLKSKLPLSQETCLISRETCLERDEMGLERNEARLVSCECTRSTNTSHSPVEVVAIFHINQV